ncbi:hypothetical protein BGZ47_007621 [Haplosporangium gracile]|nr:hypothetical protein BGZ47_007621 [Haplosporangium gracile]
MKIKKELQDEDMTLYKRESPSLESINHLHHNVPATPTVSPSSFVYSGQCKPTVNHHPTQYSAERPTPYIYDGHWSVYRDNDSIGVYNDYYHSDVCYFRVAPHHPTHYSAEGSTPYAHHPHPVVAGGNNYNIGIDNDHYHADASHVRVASYVRIHKQRSESAHAPPSPAYTTSPVPLEGKTDPTSTFVPTAPKPPSYTEAPSISSKSNQPASNNAWINHPGDSQSWENQPAENQPSDDQPPTIQRPKKRPIQPLAEQPSKVITKQPIIEPSVKLPRKDAKGMDKHLLCTHPGCGLVFKRRFNLESHITTHDPNRERLYMCDRPHCDKTFTRKHDLTRHRSSVHHGDGQYVCDSCKKTFSRRDGLQRHYKRSLGLCA